MYVFLVLKIGLDGSVGLMARSWGFMVSFGPGTKESQGGESNPDWRGACKPLKQKQGELCYVTWRLVEKTAHVTLKCSLPPRVGISLKDLRIWDDGLKES